MEAEKKKLEMAKLPPKPKYSPQTFKQKPSISPKNWFGVTIQNVTPEMKEKFDLTKAEGALVAEVAKDSPAEKGGLQRGDVIITFDDKK